MLYLLTGFKNLASQRNNNGLVNEKYANACYEGRVSDEVNNKRGSDSVERSTKNL